MVQKREKMDSKDCDVDNMMNEGKVSEDIYDEYLR